jgi:hypothetical protein
MTAFRRRVLVLMAVLGGVLGGLDILPVHGAPITSITDLNNFRDTRSLNDIGAQQGDVLQFGAEVFPNGFTSTTRISAVQGGVHVPPTGSVQCGGFTVNPNFCANSVTFNSALNGPWNLTFTNGSDQATAQTPAPTTADLTAPAPFPVSVTISGSGSSPTLSWTVPAGFTPSAVRVQVFDKTATNAQGVDNIVFSSTFAANVTTFTVPPSANLLANHPYVLNVQLIETRDGTASTGNPNANISRRSFSTFDFTPLAPGTPPQILLPTVGPGVGAAYQFNAVGVKAGQTIFVDPFVAIGYKYALGTGNPNFASVLLPAVQNTNFTLRFPSGQSLVQQQLGPNLQFFFPAGGVSAFDVTGIDPSANLDPGNVTAFITGLTFVGDGDFTGTMTPIIEDLATPEPSTLLLWGTSMAGLRLVARRRQRRHS